MLTLSGTHTCFYRKAAYLISRREITLLAPSACFFPFEYLRINSLILLYTIGSLFAIHYLGLLRPSIDSFHLLWLVYYKRWLVGLQVWCGVHRLILGYSSLAPTMMTQACSCPSAVWCCCTRQPCLELHHEQLLHSTASPPSPSSSSRSLHHNSCPRRIWLLA
jgi:hypothetical protein